MKKNYFCLTVIFPCRHSSASSPPVLLYAFWWRISGISETGFYTLMSSLSPNHQWWSTERTQSNNPNWWPGLIHHWTLMEGKLLLLCQLSHASTSRHAVALECQTAWQNAGFPQHCLHRLGLHQDFILPEGKPAVFRLLRGRSQHSPLTHRYYNTK